MKKAINNWEILLQAVEAEDLEFIKFFVEARAKNKIPPLLNLTMSRANTPFIQELYTYLRQFNNIYTVDNLEQACRTLKYELVKAHLEKGINCSGLVHQVTWCRRSMYQNKAVDILKLLFEYNHKEEQEDPTLWKVTHNGDYEIISLLLKMGYKGEENWRDKIKENLKFYGYKDLLEQYEKLLED
jgi:hypothetical protein